TLAAVVASSPAVERLGENRDTRRNASDIEPVAGFFDGEFGTARLGRREKDTVRSAANVCSGAEDADVGFGLVVIRGEIFVGDGPCAAGAVAREGLEIDGGEGGGEPPQMVGAAADDTRAEPFDLRPGSGSERLAFVLPRPVGRENLAEVGTRLPA